MHRLTARLLLLLLLASVFAPAALAISTPDPHACCRRAHHPFSGQSELLSLPECCRRGDCSLPLTVFLWGGVPSQATFFVAPFRITIQSKDDPIRRIKPPNSTHPVRGPPTFSIA